MAPLSARQAPSQAENPLANLKEEVDRVLAAAGFGFTAEQENSIVLMMEDRRRASEELFGALMDFRAGPTQGQENDRLRSAIEWMQGEFVLRLDDYLTGEQSAAWNDFVGSGGLDALGIEESGANRQEASRPNTSASTVTLTPPRTTTTDSGRAAAALPAPKSSKGAERARSTATSSFCSRTTR